MAFALQRVHLFSASIRDNLVFGLHPQPELDLLREAAQKAQILTEIEAFKEQWATEIGEKGIRLSGGQKQRLAFARLLLRRAEIYLLDDVLSAVDSITEAKLIKTIQGLGATVLIISHRRSVLEICDRVLYLKQGQLIGDSSFSDLINQHPELNEDLAHASNTEPV